jgi:hypothetical protein
VSSRSKGKYALFSALKPKFTQKKLRYLRLTLGANENGENERQRAQYRMLHLNPPITQNQPEIRQVQSKRARRSEGRSCQVSSGELALGTCIQCAIGASQSDASNGKRQII